MPGVSNWSCQGSDLAGVISENCFVTGYANATTSASTSTPIYVQDAGNVQYGLAWVVFFLAMIFLGMVWNIIPFNQ